MKADRVRINSYLMQIRKNSSELNELIAASELKVDSVPLKAVKYLLIELAEAMSNTIQHILAKEKGIAVSGYIDTVVKGNTHGVLSDDLFHRLKPFFDFRNSLIHRYWIIDDQRLIGNILAGCNDFELFVAEIEAHLNKKGGKLI